jgi:signal transduction histidine kinase
MNLDDKSLLNELEKRFLDQKKTLSELQSLNDELKQVNKRLEDSESLKSHFISNIANEIVNPFSSIIGLSRNILQSGSENWEQVQKMTKLIHSEAFNLDFQLKNIFVAAKIEAGEINPEYVKVDVHSIVHSIIDDFAYEALKKKLKFNIDKQGDPFFISDPEKIRLIISNLISNAIKFSYEEKSIEILVSVADKSLKVIVKDCGTGISQENQQIIFDRFKRIDSGINSDNRGHGLGLSINKALIEALNGEIEFKTKENIGTTFSILIPEPNIETTDFAPDGNEFLFDSEVESF